MRQEQSYLLRLWNDGKRGGFRASLEEVRTKKTLSFATLEKLSRYLQGLEGSGEKVYSEQNS